MQIVWKGTFDLTTTYNVGDVVYYIDDGFTYICKKQTRGIPPYFYESCFELLSGFNITRLDGGEF
jgi:hypothetical protein